MCIAPMEKSENIHESQSENDPRDLYMIEGGRIVVRVDSGLMLLPFIRRNTTLLVRKIDFHAAG